MQRSWIIGLTVAGVAGTGTASYAAMGTASTDTPTTVADVSLDTTPVLAGDSIRTITYQVGPAGTATLATDGTTIVVAAVTAGTGWTVVSASAPAAHVEVQYTDGTQLVTFIADLVNGDMAISITNTGVDAIVVTPITTDVTDTTDPSDTLPATPPTVLDPVTSTPPPPVTTAPSGGHDDDDDDEVDDHGDDHEEEHESEDHEEEEDD